MTLTPSMFYAYPAEPVDVAESIEAAISEINSGATVRIDGWKGISGTGKVLIEEITKQIDESELFGCDLTVLSHNVLFELGYAIGKERRVWVSVSEVIDSERRGLRKIDTLVPIGHARYVNKAQLVSKFYADQPWIDLTAVLGKGDHTRSPVRPRGASVLYLKSALATDSSITLSQELDSSKIFGERIVDDPSEVPHESLDWYIQKTRRADAVIVHLLSNENQSSESHNAKCSLVAGLAFGMGKPLLMLAHSPFHTPIDYHSLLKVHATANQCRDIIDRWLRENETSITEIYNQIANFDINRKASSELARLSVGETVAENESHLIDDYFLETGAFKQALNGHQTIFVGRKGTGKTANFFAVAMELRRDPRNHVCIIKPVSYELDGVVKLLQQTMNRAERGYLVESLWKFLIYTELAASVADEISQRPAYHQPTDGERQLLTFVQEHQALIDLPFSIRLQQTVEKLASPVSASSTAETRARISVLLHDTLLARLRAILGAALEERARVSILVDNLDKVWGEREEIEILSQMIFGLLGVAGRISNEFRSGYHRRPAANVTLAVFLRSDIFSIIQEIAREPDKLSFERITWDDAELMMRVVDNRLSYSLDETVPPPMIWDRYFTPTVLGQSTRTYIGQHVIPRPRDAIYFVREAIAQAVNRGHAKVQSDDIIAASREYSQYAFDALLVEDDPRSSKLEGVLYEFAGAPQVLSLGEVEKRIAAAGVEMDRAERYFDMLLDTNFLGIANAAGKFEYPIDESRRKTFQRVAKQIAINRGITQTFEVNKVFWPILQISS